MRGKSVRQKKNNSVENEKRKTKTASSQCIFFFEAAKSKNVSATRAFPPQPITTFTCASSKEKKSGKMGNWGGVWAKTKQKLSNGCEMNAENRLPRVVYGVSIHILLFFFCFLFRWRTPSSIPFFMNICWGFFGGECQRTRLRLTQLTR